MWCGICRGEVLLMWMSLEMRNGYRRCEAMRSRGTGGVSAGGEELRDTSVISGWIYLIPQGMTGFPY